MKELKRGIFCVESFTPEEESVGPTLRLLSSLLPFSMVKVRKVETHIQLTKAIEEWSNWSNWNYPILWMSGHGRKHGFYVHDPAGPGNRSLDMGALTEIAANSPDERDRWSGCLVHFGACSTLSGSDDACREFLRESKLAGISGYSKAVDWIRSLSFEMLYIQFLQQTMMDRNGIDEEVLDECRARLFDSRMCSGLIDHLGFRMITRTDLD